jgi:hypothetical protein
VAALAVVAVMMSNHASATSKVASTVAGNTTLESSRNARRAVRYGQHLDQVKAGPGQTVMVP